MLNFKTLAASALVLVLAGCSPSAQPADKAAPATEPGPANGPAAPAPVPSPAPGPAAAPAPPAPLQQIEPGVFRNGNFAIRVESAVLNYSSDNRRELTLRLTLSLHNTGAEPMAVTVLAPNQTANVVLDNGIALKIGSNGNGIGACTYNVADCRARAADEYTQIDAGTSVSSNFVFYQRLTDAQQAGLTAIRTGNLAMRLQVVEGAADRVVQSSILNIALRNEAR